MMNGNEVKLTDAEYIQIRDYIHEKTGIIFNENKRYLLENRLGKLLVQNQLSTFEEYYRLLKWNGLGESGYNLFYDAITTNETYFFRENHHFDTLTGHLMPELLKKKGSDRIRIWSAGCSSGNEAYTMAIYLRNTLMAHQLRTIEILASDISEEVLTKARRALYQPYDLKEIKTDAEKNKYFEPSLNTFRLREEYRSMVRFSQVNLLDPLRMRMITGVDIIFCRNVIIYFSEEAKKKVINSFYEALHHGGYLILGHSESLHSISSAFKLIRKGASLIYQKE